MDKKPKDERAFIRIELTEPQREEVKQTTGKDVEALELSVRELEDRIVPRALFES